MTALKTARPRLARPGGPPPRDARNRRPPAGLVPPPRADLHGLDHQTFVRCRRVVDLSCLVRFFEPRLAKQTGRPMAGGMNVEALLVAMLATAVSNGPMHCTAFAKVLHSRLSDRDRKALGLTGPRLAEIPARATKHVKAKQRQQWKSAYKQVERLLDRMLALVDPSPNPSGQRLTHDEFAARVKPMTKQQQAERHRLLDWCANRLLEATFLTLPKGVRDAWDGSLAVDATFVATHACGTDLDFDLYRSADGDASWWGRTGDHRPAPGADLGERDSQGRLVHKHGYDAELAVMGSADPSTVGRFPGLVLAMTLHQPGFDPAGNGISMLAGIAERHDLADPETGEVWPADVHPDGAARTRHRAGRLAGDDAYTGKPADQWALPARALGYKTVSAYSKTMSGLQGTHQGAILVDGAWYSPGMPQAVRDCTKDYLYKRISRERRDELLAQRPQYALRPNGAPGPDGTQRYRCPASGTPGTGTRPVASCERKPRSTARPDQFGALPVVLPEYEHVDDDGQPLPSRLLPLIVSGDHVPALPTVCARQSIAIGPEVHAARTQDLVYLSPEWKRAYGTLRNYVEGANGVLKSHAYQSLEDGDRRRVLGLAAATFLSAFQVAAANLKTIATFYDTADWNADTAGTMTVTGPKPRRSPRRTGRKPGAQRRTGKQRRADDKAAKKAARAAALVPPTTRTVDRRTGLNEDPPPPDDDQPPAPPETAAQRRRRLARGPDQPPTP